MIPKSGYRFSDKIMPDHSKPSGAINSPVASPQACQDLVSDRAGARREVVNADAVAEQSDESSATYVVVLNVRDIGHDQVHRHAPGERTALPGDNRVGAELRVACARAAQKAVGITN